MPLKFNCPECNSEIVTQYLKIGERAKCHACGKITHVPTNATQFNGSANKMKSQSTNVLTEPSHKEKETVSYSNKKHKIAIVLAFIISVVAFIIIQVSQNYYRGWGAKGGVAAITVSYVIIRGILAVIPDYVFSSDNFWVSAQRGFLKRVQKFIKDKTDIDATDLNGCTALYYVSDNNNINIVKYLLSKKADVNIKCSGGQTALYRAARWGNEEIVSILLESGADPDYRTRSGETALYCAAKFGHEKVVKLLLEGNADHNIRLDNGESSLEVAKKYNKHKVVEILSKFNS